MGFLDNSGDIILDAVLTDTGRMRMAKGDGTFKIAKYAFGDDEINYGIYNPNATSGSAYYDLEVLQTPVLEAFTNNRSSLKHKLITMTNNNLLFLPTIKLNLNTATGYDGDMSVSSSLGNGTFLVACDVDTVNRLNSGSSILAVGDFINGTELETNNFIRCDQGMDTTKLSNEQLLSAELREQQYLIQIDNRLGRVYDAIDLAEGSPAFIDDDQIASYYVTYPVGGYVKMCQPGDLQGKNGGTGMGAGDAYEVLEGPRGTRLQFSLQSQNNLKASTFLFETMGTTKLFNGDSYFVIDSTLKVTGVTTGYMIDIPVRYVKLND